MCIVNSHERSKTKLHDTGFTATFAKHVCTVFAANVTDVIVVTTLYK